MQTMSECSRHTGFPYLEQKDRHSWSSFRSHKVHRDLLFNKTPFAAFSGCRNRCNRLCLFCDSTQFFSKIDQEHSSLLHADVAFT